MALDISRNRVRRTRVGSSRRGVTLLEVLIVIAIVGILAVLTLSAVQSARESARRTQCASNLRQLGIALNSYHTAVNSLPSACNGAMAYSAHAMILPYLDRLALYNSINFSVPFGDRANGTVTGQVISTLLCPSDRPSGILVPASNYACNLGYGYQIDHVWNGMFVNPPTPSTTLADVRDGTANTAMMAELVIGSGRGGEGDVLGSSFETPLELRKPGEFEQAVEHCAEMSFSKARSFSPFKGTAWYDGSLGLTSYNHNATVNKPSCFNGYYVTEGTWTASSRHGPSANLLLADGHVRFVKESIARAVWRATGTRSGGELVGQPE